LTKTAFLAYYLQNEFYIATNKAIKDVN